MGSGIRGRMVLVGGRKVIVIMRMSLGQGRIGKDKMRPGMRMSGFGPRPPADERQHRAEKHDIQ